MESRAPAAPRAPERADGWRRTKKDSRQRPQIRGEPWARRGGLLAPSLPANAAGVLCRRHPGRQRALWPQEQPRSQAPRPFPEPSPAAQGPQPTPAWPLHPPPSSTDTCQLVFTLQIQFSTAAALSLAAIHFCDSLSWLSLLKCLLPAPPFSTTPITPRRLRSQWPHVAESSHLTSVLIKAASNPTTHGCCPNTVFPQAPTPRSALLSGTPPCPGLWPRLPLFSPPLRILLGRTPVNTACSGLGAAPPQLHGFLRAASRGPLTAVLRCARVRSQSSRVGNGSCISTRGGHTLSSSENVSVIRVPKQSWSISPTKGKNMDTVSSGE